jgi:hypothetical protein
MAQPQRREFEVVDIGGRFAVMSREADDSWKVMYFVSTKNEAEELVTVCRSATKEGFAVIRAFDVGAPLKHVA